MTNIRWEFYPLVADDQTAHAWLQIQANLQLRPNTIDAYGRGLNDYLDFCARHQVRPETITHEHFAQAVGASKHKQIVLVVNDLRSEQI